MPKRPRQHHSKKASRKNTPKRNHQASQNHAPTTLKGLKRSLTPRTERGRKILTYSLVGVGAWIGLSYFLGAS